MSISDPTPEFLRKGDQTRHTPPPAAPPTPPLPTVGGRFYVGVLGFEQGPFDIHQLAQQAYSGQLKGETPVRPEEAPYWFPARDIPGLFSQREYLTSWLLALLLGSLGVDRFYLGYTGLGIAKIVVTFVTCGIGGLIWQIVDLILILTRQVPDVDGRPLR